MIYLPDNLQVYSIWRELLVAHHVKGAKVHDARLVAIMQAYGLVNVLTLNQPDFLRYSGVQAIHPNQIQPSPR
jgi:predicted nucleic acid-binding protein